MLQSNVIRLADCSSAPQMHLGVSSMPQRYRHVPKGPTPLLSLFSATHRLRRSSEPSRSETAVVTRNWAGGLALSHAALHDSRLKPDSSAPQHGGGRGVVHAGAVCRGIVRYGQGCEEVVGVQLCLEHQLKSGVFPMQVGRWNACEYR